MSFINIAKQIGVSSNDVNNITKGKTSISIAKKLGISSNDVQNILNSKTSLKLAKNLGLSSNYLTKLLDVIGEKGGSGLIIGLLLCQK